MTNPAIGWNTLWWLLASAAVGAVVALGWARSGWRARALLAEARLADLQQAEIEQAADDLAGRQSAAAVEQILGPMSESLRSLASNVAQHERERHAVYGRLQTEVRLLADQSREVLRGTNRVVAALGSTGTKGRWGEVHLIRVVEAAGLVEGLSYHQQATVTGPGGSLRPDLIVELGGGRQIVIDAKVPLDVLLTEAEVAADTPGDTTTPIPTATLARHATAVRQRVRELSGKEYPKQFAQAPDFVVLYLPAESLLSCALQGDPTLLEYAFDQGVVIATPTTLLSLLRIVALGWRQREAAGHAAEILELATQLVERMSLLSGHLATLGTRLGGTVEAYNKAIGSWHSRLQPTLARIADRGLDTAQVSDLTLVPTAVRAHQPTTDGR
jgi:DNA recombination protein RmuC